MVFGVEWLKKEREKVVFIYFKIGVVNVDSFSSFKVEEKVLCILFVCINNSKTKGGC